MQQFLALDIFAPLQKTGNQVFPCVRRKAAPPEHWAAAVCLRSPRFHLFRQALGHGRLLSRGREWLDLHLSPVGTRGNHQIHHPWAAGGERGLLQVLKLLIKKKTKSRFIHHLNKFYDVLWGDALDALWTRSLRVASGEWSTALSASWLVWFGCEV